MLLYDASSVFPYVIRLFVLERGNLAFDVQTIDINNMENRRLKYRTEISARGEVPALRLDDGSVLTESLAICQYLDEVAAEKGSSLFGSNANERAKTQMWLRRIDLEVVQPVIAWFRNDPASIDFYRGNRVPCPEAVVANKIAANQGLNLLDDELADGRPFICGDRISMADIYLYAQMKMMSTVGEWINFPGRTNFVAFMKMMDQREASKKALSVFEKRVEV